jgi:hypothetical protein
VTAWEIRPVRRGRQGEARAAGAGPGAGLDAKRRATRILEAHRDRVEAGMAEGETGPRKP